MERLTETIYKKGYCNSKIGCKDDCEQCEHFETMVDRLAYYEDLEEQGLLLRLPCKVGDMLYVMVLEEGVVGREIFNFEVYEETLYADVGVYSINLTKCLGKDVFLTKEEAEKKLAEMRKGCRYEK